MGHKAEKPMGKSQHARGSLGINQFKPYKVRTRDIMGHKRARHHYYLVQPVSIFFRKIQPNKTKTIILKQAANIKAMNY